METKLAPCKEQIQTLIEQNSELAAFKEQLTELADAQAVLMRTVEGLQNSGEGSEDTSSDVGDECPREISPIATVPHTRNPFRIQDSIASPGMCSGSSSKGDSPSPWAKGAREYVDKGTSHGIGPVSGSESVRPTAFAQPPPATAGPSAGGIGAVGVGQMKLDAPSQYNGVR